MPSVKRLFRAAPIPGAIALVIVGSNASAQPVDQFDTEVRPFLTTYCGNCHNNDLLVADLTFELFGTGPDPTEHSDLWK